MGTRVFIMLLRGSTVQCTKRKTISIMSEGSKYCAIVKSVKGLTEFGKESSSASKSEKWVPTTYCIYILYIEREESAEALFIV